MNESGVLRAVEGQLSINREGISHSQPLVLSVVDRVNNHVKLLLTLARRTWLLNMFGI
jgi:hypothetical protein